MNINGVKSNFIYLSDKYFLQKIKKPNYYDLVFANILFNPLYCFAPSFGAIIKRNNYLIISGFLKEQIQFIINRYHKFGFKVKKIFLLNEWGALLLKKI